MRYFFLDEANKPQGPVEVEALRKLRDAGVLNADSLIAGEGAESWVPLKTVIPCLAKQAAAPATAPNVSAAEARFVHEAHAAKAGEAAVGSAGSLFYWIAALSVANSVSGAVGSETYFFFGLGISLIIGAIGHELGSIGIGIALVVNLLISGAFALFGYFGNRYHLWPFIVGGFFYGLDGLIFLLAGDWLGVIIHVAIFCFLVKGALATRGIGE